MRSKPGSVPSQKDPIPGMGMNHESFKAGMDGHVDQIISLNHMPIRGQGLGAVRLVPPGCIGLNLSAGCLQ